MLSAMLIFSQLLNCSGKGTQVGTVLVIGSALKAAQMIQEKRRKQAGKTYECTLFCSHNQIPCGDECLPLGATCTVAPRRACYGGEPTMPEGPLPKEELHPAANHDIIFAPVP